jgi:hypothetical protein
MALLAQLALLLLFYSHYLVLRQAVGGIILLKDKIT